MLKKATTFGAALLAGATLNSGAAWAGSAVSYDVFANYSPAAVSIAEGGVAPETLGVNAGALIGSSTFSSTDFGRLLVFVPPAGGTGRWTTTAIHNFSGPEGANPQGFLTSWGGVMLGATFFGGANNVGVLYQVANSGGAYQYTKLMDFGGTDCPATKPHGSLVAGPGGYLYGAGGVTTVSGNYGTVFALVPPHDTVTHWGCHVVYNYTSKTQGSSPQAFTYADGALYYITNAGGSGGVGQAERLIPQTSDPLGAWTHEVIHAFSTKNNDGRYPLSPLLKGADGAFYGVTTAGGGTGKHGTVYRLTPPATVGGVWGSSIVHAFAGGVNDGYNPKGALYQAPDGTIYGTTKSGGSANLGTVYQLNPTNGAFILVHSFTGGKTASSDGKIPFGGLQSFGDAHTVIGVTQKGGLANRGTLFKLSVP